MIQESFEEVGTWDVRALARNLRDKFALVALDMELSDVDKASKSEAIGQAILALGGKESSKPDKLFSTPSADGPVCLQPHAKQSRCGKLVVPDWQSMRLAEVTRRCVLKLQLWRWN